MSADTRAYARANIANTEILIGKLLVEMGHAKKELARHETHRTTASREDAEYADRQVAHTNARLDVMTGRMDVLDSELAEHTRKFNEIDSAVGPMYLARGTAADPRHAKNITAGGAVKLELTMADFVDSYPEDAGNIRSVTMTILRPDGTFHQTYPALRAGKIFVEFGIDASYGFAADNKIHVRFTFNGTSTKLLKDNVLSHSTGKDVSGRDRLLQTTTISGTLFRSEPHNALAFVA